MPMWVNFGCSLTASLESYVMRARHLNNASGSELDRKHAIEYIKDKYPSFSLEKEMTEVYILRDILTHNHLWEELYDNTTGVSITEGKSSGDRKFRENIDENTNSTKVLSLNIYPTKVNYSDAKKVIKKVWEILLFLENEDRSICYISNSYVKYSGEQTLFSEVLEQLN